MCVLCVRCNGVQGVFGVGYEGVGCGVLGIQCLYVRLWTDRIRQDVHDDGRADGKLLLVPSYPFYARRCHWLPGHFSCSGKTLGRVCVFVHYNF